MEIQVFQTLGVTCPPRRSARPAEKNHFFNRLPQIIHFWRSVGPNKGPEEEATMSKTNTETLSEDFGMVQQ